MQKDSDTKYFFVDEAGDPTFYNRYGKLIVGNEGCSKIFILGLIKTTNPNSIRKELALLHQEIAKDQYLAKIPSIKKSNKFFHAKDDCPEIRAKVFNLLLKLDFTAEFVVARKIETIFQKRHQGKENVFYDDMIAKLFENKLHTSQQNIIYFAIRGNKKRQEPLEAAIQSAILTFETKWKKKVDSEIKVFPQSLNGEQCLEIVDYMNWAVQRLYNFGEDRYYSFIEEKVSFLLDIYDFKKYPKNYYSRNNKFHISKITPL